jgi:PPM family protein phosphatase
LEYIALSNIGLLRSNNQDSVLVVENKGILLAMVCDGIGGANAGDVASLTTVNHFEKAFLEVESFEDEASIIAWFELNLKYVNDLLIKMAKENSEYSGMGTTCVAAVVSRGRTIGFNIGDSRIYDYRHNQLNPLTHDQTYAYMMYLENEITKEEAQVHPKRNILMNALGIRGIVSFETVRIPSGWDRLLLCSDGLHDYVELHLMESAFENDLETTANTLIEHAYASGGPDNISVVIIEGVKHE